MRELADPYCLRSDEATLLTRAPWRRLCVLGDSIAAGTGDPVAGYADRSWADRLAAALTGSTGPTGYVNLGAIGARAGEVLAGQLDRALAFGPDLSVVAAGANDAFRRSFDPAAIEAALGRLVGALRESGALVVTFGCFDLGRTRFLPADQRAGLSERLHALGDLTRRVNQGGVHVDFLRHPAFGDELLSADGLHVNRRGHAIIAAEVIRALAAHQLVRPC